MKFLSKWSLWILLPLFNTLNQVAMKLTAGSVKDQPFGLDWLLDAVQCPYIWMSFACEVINFALWLAILKRHNLSEAFPLTSISYAALMFTSWFFFHEPMHWQQLAGVTVIMAGIALLGFKESASVCPAANAAVDTPSRPD